VAMTFAAALCGAGVGIAALLLFMSRVERPLGNDLMTRSGGRARTDRPFIRVSWARSVPVAAVSVLAALVTGWPVAALLAGAAAFFAPTFLRITRKANTASRTEAIAIWTELLRDTLAGASGLSQAIIATAPLAPQIIHAETNALSTRLSNGMSLSDGLRMFADEVQDPGCDLVVCALTLATSVRTQRVLELLGALSDSMRQEVAMRLRVESKRASARSGVRTIAIFSIGFIALLLVVGRTYLAPFGSFQGQIVLLASGLLDAVGIVLMVNLVKDPDPLRLLNPEVAEVTA
jgi:tight adherence protein B